jgi:[acyl-carrier-protein] S-malonyltransferase
MSGLLILFPGQGSQKPGMAEYLWEYPKAREAFVEAGDVLGWDIGELCRHGTMEELTRTDRTQLTILACSVATWRVLEEQGVSFSVATGHSLGEYSALVASGRMTFADALRVVDVRGRGMQACGAEKGGTMAAVIGLDDAAVDEICASLSEVWVANYNSPGQVVISGSEDSIATAGELAKERGAGRVVPLPVSGAFHTPYMAGAAKSLTAALLSVRFAPGHGKFFSTTELGYPEPDELAQVLARQLMSPVKFAQSMNTVLGGKPTERPAAALEVGPGNVLTGLLKRIDRDFPAAATADAGSLQKALEEVGGRE